MSLYYTRTLTSGELGTTVSTDAGSLCLYPFTLQVAETLLLQIIHNAPVQDWSIRVWVSEEPNGMPVRFLPAHVFTWNARRDQTFPVYVYDRSLLAPAHDNVIGIQPGNYFVNVLNLINSENSFILSLDPV